MAVDELKKYTAEEFLQMELGSEKQYELIDGVIVSYSAPNELHQDIVLGLGSELRSFIRGNGGSCKPFIAPFDVKLDDHTVVQPDVLVVCDQSKLDGKRCNGAPDIVIEVVSSDKKNDYSIKLEIYKEAGVKEYWIIDPSAERTVVYIFDNSRVTDLNIYTFDKPVPVNIFGSALTITIDNLAY